MKNRISRLSVYSFVIFSLSASRLLAFGDLGHSAVALIAAKKIKPSTANFLASILGAEPLVVAATFPDHVRDVEAFKPFDPYHFMEIPFGVDAHDLKPTERPKRDAMVVISQFPPKLSDPNVPRDEKMLFLRYFIHVVGDVHQPLHVGNGVDMGANLCEVKWMGPHSEHGYLTKLHKVLDTSLFDYSRAAYFEKHPSKDPKKQGWFGPDELVDYLLEKTTAKQEQALRQAAKLPAVEWYAESRKLHSVAYPDGEVPPAERTYCRVLITEKDHRKIVDGKFDPKTIPTLGESYVKKAVPMIEQQVLKAGYRLAYTLDAMASKVRTPKVDVDALLNSVQLENEDGFTPLPMRQ